MGKNKCFGIASKSEWTKHQVSLKGQNTQQVRCCHGKSHFSSCYALPVQAETTVRLTFVRDTVPILDGLDILNHQTTCQIVFWLYGNICRFYPGSIHLQVYVNSN